MTVRPQAPRLADIIDAIERVRAIIGDMTFETFEANWQSQWLVERGVEIMSEASRHLADDLKARHPGIPWRKVAGIGNVLRHNYEIVAAPVILHDLLPLEQVCREELEAIQDREDPAGES